MNIHIFDNLMNQETHKLIEKEVYDAQLKPYWALSQSRRSNPPKDNWHWHYSIFQDTAIMPVATSKDIEKISEKHPGIMSLWNETQKKIFESPVGYKCDFARAYINAHTYGVDGLIHSDDGDYTAIYYPLSEWNIEWEGGTCFYNKNKTDVVHYNAYTPNRLIIFPAADFHRAMPVARECYKLRPVVVFKCIIDVNCASYAKKYYLDNSIK